ncbi:MAG: PTS sugar transporter subunit IIA [Gammaproteobacteria bacterium]|nr:PTS sugar transporter subunit IIA [Gammaproteobacteria bacterium]
MRGYDYRRVVICFESIFTPVTVQFVHNCHSRKSALQHAAQIIHQERKSIDPRELLEKLTEREELGCTVVENTKVALPHCRFDECITPIGALLRFVPEVSFGNAGAVSLAFALVVPPETDETHLQILKTIAVVCSNPSQLSQLLEVRSPTNLRDTFLHYARQLD